MYARGKANGQIIHSGDVVMLYYEYDGKYVSIQGENSGDDTSLNFCPGVTPQLTSAMEYAPKMLFASTESHEHNTASYLLNCILQLATVILAQLQLAIQFLLFLTVISVVSFLD